MRTEQFFTVGKNNIDYVGSNFREHFYGMDFTVPKKLKLETKTLPRNMLDKEILAELKPAESSLGELAYALKQDAILLKNGYANIFIFYIRDKENTLWAVDAYWYSNGQGWNVFADSVGNPDWWDQGYQVFSRKFSSEIGPPAGGLDSGISEEKSEPEKQTELLGGAKKRMG